MYALGFVQNGAPASTSVGMIDAICKFSRFLEEEHSFSLQTSPGGPCIPGTVRLLVSADGSFYPCEHVSECSDAMKIGSLQEGFDVNKVLSLLNVAQLTEKNCRNCWAYHQCYQCAKFCDNFNELSPTKRLQECHTVRSTLDYHIRCYIMLKEIMAVKNEKQECKECCCIPVQF